MSVVCRLLSFAAVVTTALGFQAASVAAADQLIVVERASSDTVTDLGAKGDSVGDVLSFANEVYDQGDTILFGHDNGWCVRTVVGQVWECVWTLLLDKGQITVEGPYYDTKDSELAVTGGTGEYASVRGVMKLHARDNKGTEYDFVYDLVP